MGRSMFGRPAGVRGCGCGPCAQGGLQQTRIGGSGSKLNCDNAIDILLYRGRPDVLDLGRGGKPGPPRGDPWPLRMMRSHGSHAFGASPRRSWARWPWMTPGGSSHSAHSLRRGTSGSTSVVRDPSRSSWTNIWWMPSRPAASWSRATRWWTSVREVGFPLFPLPVSAGTHPSSSGSRGPSAPHSCARRYASSSSAIGSRSWVDGWRRCHVTSRPRARRHVNPGLTR